jgi:hypothetical protein
MTTRKIFSYARLVLSFALLGALVAGTFFGWTDSPLDPRTLGAVAGGAGIVIVKLLHLV